MDLEVVSRSTNAPFHHFFGFHDVEAWNSDGRFLACLEVKEINRPPTGMSPAVAGVVSADQAGFRALAETVAYNFPQGARQLWCPDSDSFWVNMKVGECWGSMLVDVDGRKHLEIGQALYLLSNDGKRGYGLNFARLNRLGGYGYVGLPDPFASEARPKGDGIYEVDLVTGRSRLLVSIADASAGAGGDPGAHHYLTHVVRNPSGTRLLFLNRWWLPDGGIGHRLLSCRDDGTDITCHAEGFLSHFDWWDDHRFIIWGRISNVADKLRRVPGAARLGWVLRRAKGVLRILRPPTPGGGMSFLLIDIRDGSVQPFWPELLTEDGHPMFCPLNRDWLGIDTYPDADRTRQLKLLNAVTGKVVPLGDYQFPKLPLDLTSFDKSVEHVDPLVLKNVDLNKLAFARSGLHCDLHPRWRPDGKALGFDSIHEGTRQCYVVDTTEYTEQGIDDE